MKSSRPYFLAALAAIAVIGFESPASAKNLFSRDVPAERGYRVAARDCAGCHSIDKVGNSPRPSAPPFREVRPRYNELSLAREFAAIGQVGHYEMPPKPISDSDGRDLAAFIESLGGASR